MTDYLPDLAALLPSWQLSLRSEGKAPGTVKTYSDGVTGFLRWCAATGAAPQIEKPTVQAWIADLLDGGAQSATAIARFKGVLGSSAKWLVAEGELTQIRCSE